MKAISFDTFGGPEVLHVTELPLPEPGPGQVRIRVHAAGVNPADGKIRSGAMEQVFATRLPAVPGFEMAGVVDALGDGVTGTAVGDRVVGWSAFPAGGYAEYALSGVYGPIPDELEFTRAVTLPVATATSTRVLGLLDVKAGETLLIHGASGSVGEVATQFAITRGATVIGTASEANQDRVRALGAVATVYGPGLVDRVRALAPNGVDAVLDAAGRGVLPNSIELRGGTDRIVTIADPAAQGLGVTFSGGPDVRSGDDLARYAAQLVAGKLTTSVGSLHPLTDAVTAQELSDSGRAGGKVVLVP